MSSGVSGLRELPLPPDSAYVQPRRLAFEYKGKARVWDVCLCHDAVCVLVLHRDRKALLLVQQLRPPVLYRLMQQGALNPTGETHELCAGILDKGKSLVQTAKEEVLEELGFDAPLEGFERVCAYRSAVGVLGYETTMFYTEVDNTMKVSEGGGVDSEDIQIVCIPIQQVEQYAWDEAVPKPAGLILALMWFLRYKAAQSA
jgi:UDP-sugar diphosphatase